ncbi:MAG: hypothetical protein KJ888_17430, partial [Gammaproteobacteria bacterium]|nr:hypothetical protein [Gammaproteobacteria bacterium]
MITALVIQLCSALGILCDDHVANKLNRLSFVSIKKQLLAFCYRVAFFNHWMKFFNSSLNRFTSELNLCQA